MPFDALINQAETRPDATAFIFGSDRWTYGRMRNEVLRLAMGMRRRGIVAGDRVVLHMTNVPELAIAHYACFAIGALSTPLNILLKAPELQPLLARLRPRLYIGQQALYPLVEAVSTDILPQDMRYLVDGDARRAGARPWRSLMAEDSGGFAAPTGYDDAPAVLLGTSGTTGDTKFAIHTPRSLAAAIEALEHIGLEEGHVGINAMPMVHASGFFILLVHVSAGEPMILFERFDPDAVLDAVERHGATWLVGTPFMFSLILQTQRENPRDVGSLKFACSVGDACPIALQRAFTANLGVPLHTIWGASEVVGATTFGLEPGPVSRLLPTVQIRIVDDAGSDVPRGQGGEVWLKGDMISPGYWREEEIVPLSPGGWYQTGDLMRQGEGDDLWFIGRKKELIIIGGANVAPVEVETVLCNHPAVADVAVVGLPCPVLGQRIGAVIALAPAAGKTALDEIRRYASSELADYKVPERWLVVDAVPRNRLSKIDRRSAAALFESADAEPMQAAS
jgi:acyl-CoA synthetase (AMP-forming)/AMP-acid ligase II